MIIIKNFSAVLFFGANTKGLSLGLSLGLRLTLSILLNDALVLSLVSSTAFLTENSTAETWHTVFWQRLVYYNGVHYIGRYHLFAPLELPARLNPHQMAEAPRHVWCPQLLAHITMTRTWQALDVLDSLPLLGSRVSIDTAYVQ